VPGGALPCFAATTVAVADLARLRDCLQRGGIAHRPVRLDGAEAVAATLPPTLGDAILFRAA